MLRIFSLLLSLCLDSETEQYVAESTQIRKFTHANTQLHLHARLDIEEKKEKYVYFSPVFPVVKWNDRKKNYCQFLQQGKIFFEKQDRYDKLVCWFNKRKKTQVFNTLTHNSYRTMYNT